MKRLPVPLTQLVDVVDATPVVLNSLPKPRANKATVPYILDLTAHNQLVSPAWPLAQLAIILPQLQQNGDFLLAKTMLTQSKCSKPRRPASLNKAMTGLNHALSKPEPLKEDYANT